jgi:hypothetical protein
VLAPAQRLPEIGIGLSFALDRIDEDRMMLADDIPALVTDSLEEQLVGVQNGAVQPEVDHRLRVLDRLDLAALVVALLLESGGILGDLHHGLDQPFGVADRHIARAEPDFAAMLADPHVGLLQGLPPARRRQRSPRWLRA